jgi:predicted GNAT family N-acyltransferase
MEEILKIQIATTDDEITEAMSIREKVFQQEQAIPRELDFDGKDDVSDHFVAYLGDFAVGTGRLRYAFDKVKIVRIERLAVLSEFRGRGIGKGIMAKMHKYLQEKNITEVMLQAQEPLAGFYEKLGYVKAGEPFLEVGKPHVKMLFSFDK